VATSASLHLKFLMHALSLKSLLYMLRVSTIHVQERAHTPIGTHAQRNAHPLPHSRAQTHPRSQQSPIKQNRSYSGPWVQATQHYFRLIWSLGPFVHNLLWSMGASHPALFSFDLVVGSFCAQNSPNESGPSSVPPPHPAPPAPAAAPQTLQHAAGVCSPRTPARAGMGVRAGMTESGLA